jgi:hypothetical protein
VEDPTPTLVLIDYQSPGAANIDGKSDRLSFFFMFLRFIESWVLCFVVLGIAFSYLPKYGSGDAAKWPNTIMAVVLSLPYWCLVRAAVYRRCYPSGILFAQALFLCINYGLALGLAVRFVFSLCMC